VTWPYVRRLNRGHGVTSVGFDPYRLALGESDLVTGRLLGRRWLWEAAKAAGKTVLRHGWDWARAAWTPMEGEDRILRAEYQLGRLIELCRRRSLYDQAVLEPSSVGRRATA